MALIAEELELRLAQLAKLETMHGTTMGVPTASVNELRIFFGGRGIWYDAARTSKLAMPGVTVGVLHTGRHYDDQLDPGGVIYNYPKTKSLGKDGTEVEATKNARRLGLPVFVIVGDGQTRDVHLSWVEKWDDDQASFLLSFGDKPPDAPPKADDEQLPFVLFSHKPKKLVVAKARPGQQRFAFEVRARFGASCAFCGLAIQGLLEAAHIVPVERGGSDDPRNGLPLCPTHHRAYDRDLLGIDPLTSAILPAEGSARSALGVFTTDLSHLKSLPHPDALAWRHEHHPLQVAVSTGSPLPLYSDHS